jgi:transglutaminase-like putative cysteine protease
MRLQENLHSTYYLDFTHPAVREFVARHGVADASATENVVKLFYAVRDGFSYNPYKLDLRREGLKASSLVARDYGYCVEKAVLLAAAARAVGVPSRLYFGNVRNHIATEKLQRVLGTDVMVFHGSTEIYLDGRWVKATPAFDLRLCEKLGVAPLEFDGTSDCIFQAYDGVGRQFMEYLEVHGSFDDLPYEKYLEELARGYPHLAKGLAHASEADLRVDLSAS